MTAAPPDDQPADRSTRAPVVVMRGVNKHFGDLHVLKDINLAGIRFRDLSTTQSSLEDIFVDLVRQNR